ncbi:thiamine diphosphokinase [Rhizobium bangladeshense]|uniref:Thiamine diphosphokinase n=1 Tax=Rhizobium bangladeshense TaxID=1138189 RepID=A0ABS7LQP5_9HYPH|nr:thiamine diphosphokinase [Rhizobium bangladeshense]MBX4873060.1 thiamine diphosphokinase [Rhizobium bangladeshense]MBX4884437.1 thiamine diphosphokinase [Rhizobium bangladeshense]MBX4933249.1 thiamine diphosphokinase [Rhizobium bangladeshense]MBY3593411.1 thiamine diphosphokinase [Rhizobium bangladeshense]QSY88502.1 thiamine diphosphokinase [Rhizobium bangladeshense]
MSQSTFTILLGGELSPTERLRRAIGGSRFIAADGGMRHAMALGVIPELWVGDFDSTPPELEGDFLDVPKLPYPAAKAATDGEIAVSEAVARGARRLILAGALAGERSDHALQHLLSAVGLAEEGFDVLLTSGKEEAVPLLAGTIELDLPKGSLFSVSGFSELKGLSIENARYQLADFQLPFGSSRTISNVAEGKVRFSLKSGRAIVLARPYDLSGV